MPAGRSAVACTLTIAAVLVAVTGAAPDDRVIAGIAHGLLVAIPAGVGIAALARRPGDRFARLLLLAAGLWALTSLVLTSDELTYSVGRIAGWTIETLLVYLLLAFPSGRLTTALERRTWQASLLIVGVLYLPTALVVQGYPQPLEGTSCVPDCPGNAFALTSSQPALVEDVIRPLREVLTVLVFGVVVGILARRTMRAGSVRRASLIPVTLAAAARGLLFPAFFLMRGAEAGASQVESIYWVYLLVLPLIPLSFAAGLLFRRLSGALALQRLAVGMPSGASADDLARAMAAAFEDPSLRLLDATAMPRPGRGTVPAITADGRTIAVVGYDTSLAPDPGVMRAAGRYTAMFLEHRRLVDELQRSVAELSASRARITVVGDEARRRIERDLHDGAQQRLVALRIRLGRESDRLQASAPEAASVLEMLGDETEDTIDEIRALAHGIYPSLLADRGLADALRAAALGASIRTVVSVDGLGRYSPEVESSVYFACLEALQNATKHARGASRVEIALSGNGALRFAVSDDGAGFDLAAVNGGGLTSLRDRLTAVGGDLQVASAPGDGTCVSGSVPV
jgi:signal transduction histidine kinase